MKKYLTLEQLREYKGKLDEARINNNGNGDLYIVYHWYLNWKFPFIHKIIRLEERSK